MSRLDIPPTPGGRLALASVLLALLMATATAPGVAAQEPNGGDPPASHSFSEGYTAGGAVELMGVTSGIQSSFALDSRGCFAAAGADLCPMFGVAQCDHDNLVGTRSFTEGLGLHQTVAVQPVGSIGGTCGPNSPVVVRPGDTVVVGVDDASLQPVTFGVCVDGDGDDLCRPESFEAETDTWVMRHCDEPGPLAFQHQGAPGSLYVFVFEQLAPQVCLPSSGLVWGMVDTATSSIPECADGLDNDDDGNTDRADLGCVSQGDGDERGEPPSPPGLSSRCLNFSTSKGSSYAEHLVVGSCAQAPVLGGLPECADGANNDPPTDGSPPDGTDFPFDPDCDSPLDDRERGPACSDHIENDGDGHTDYPSDPGCTGPDDDDEYNVWACSDGVDNDGDTRRDYPNDPGCNGPYDNSEWNTWACSDGRDNDGDGLADYPRDPGCYAWYDDNEWNPRPKN